MTLRTLIENAITALDDDENGDHTNIIAEAQLKLHELLQAAEITSIKDDHLDSMYAGNDCLIINTTWFACGSANQGSYLLPLTILDAPDPLKAAKIHGLELKAKFHTKAYDDAVRALNSHKEQLTKINNELTKLKEQA